MISAREAQAMAKLVCLQKKKEAIDSVKDWCENFMEPRICEAISLGKFDTSLRINEDIELSLTEIRACIKEHFEPYGYKVTVNDCKRVSISW